MDSFLQYDLNKNYKIDPAIESEMLIYILNLKSQEEEIIGRIISPIFIFDTIQSVILNRKKDKKLSEFGKELFPGTSAYQIV